jgi:AcrR family transcriptional regulator
MPAARASATVKSGGARCLPVARDNAGVGSGTVRRHFPTRQALLAAVFQERVEHLCQNARGLLDAPDARAALLDGLGAVNAMPRRAKAPG